MNIRSEIKDIEKNIIDWRRDFHRYPELGFDEHRTSKIIGEALKEMGLAPQMNVGKTGVTADLTFGEGPTIALRADMDALPMQETSGLDFSSKHDGVMHACGHDGQPLKYSLKMGIVSMERSDLFFNRRRKEQEAPDI